MAQFVIAVSSTRDGMNLTSIPSAALLAELGRRLDDSGCGRSSTDLGFGSESHGVTAEAPAAGGVLPGAILNVTDRGVDDRGCMMRESPLTPRRKRRKRHSAAPDAESSVTTASKRRAI